MSIQVSAFWQEVGNEVGVIKAAIAKQGRQPRDGTVYIAGVRLRGEDPDRTPGVVSLAPLKLAAQRIVEGTQRLATDDEIKKYLGDQNEAKKAMEGAAAKGRGQIVFTQPKPVEG